MNNPLLLTSALAQIKGSSDWNERTGGTLKANLTPFECRAVLDALATAERERDEARAETETIRESCAKRENQLRADLQAAREDSARLDWLAGGDTYGKFSDVRRHLPTACYPTDTAKDCIRSAIDSARAGGAGK